MGCTSRVRALRSRFAESVEESVAESVEERSRVGCRVGLKSRLPSRSKSRLRVGRRVGCRERRASVASRSKSRFRDVEQSVAVGRRVGCRERRAVGRRVGRPERCAERSAERSAERRGSPSKRARHSRSRGEPPDTALGRSGSNPLRPRFGLSSWPRCRSRFRERQTAQPQLTESADGPVGTEHSPRSTRGCVCVRRWRAGCVRS